MKDETNSQYTSTCTVKSEGPDTATSLNDGVATIESIILQHSSRGMDILRRYMPADYCMKAAEDLLRQQRGKVLICTGFYCFGTGETDGPVGTYFLAKALKELGYSPVIVTDMYSMRYFIAEPDYQLIGYDNESFEYIEGYNSYADMRNRSYTEDCVAMISIERCGRASDGRYYNMKGVDISRFTSGIDDLFIRSNCLTIGIGDGGNEIGMGNLEDIIREEINIIPSSVKVDDLIIATVSNWGAYGFMAALGKLTGKRLLPSSDDVREYLRYIVILGAVDGIKGEGHYSVDGFGPEVDEEIIDALSSICVD